MSNTTWLTIADASRLTNIPDSTLRNRIKGGGLPCYSPDGVHLLVSLSDIDAWRDRRKIRQSGPRHWGANSSRVLAMYGEGYRDSHIASAIGITRQRVAQIRQRAGLPKILMGNTCRQCGATFIPEKPNQRKCGDHRHQIAPRIFFTCRECGTPFDRRASTIKPTSPGHYCSRACRNQSRRGHVRSDSVPKICTECGQTYMGLTSAKKSICFSCRPKEWYRRNKGNR